MIDGKNLFDQAVKNDVRTCDNNEKIVTGQVDDCTTGCLLDYVYLKKCPQQQIADLQAIQQINFPGNLDQAENTSLIIEEATVTIL